MTTIEYKMFIGWYVVHEGRHIKVKGCTATYMNTKKLMQLIRKKGYISAYLEAYTKQTAF